MFPFFKTASVAAVSLTLLSAASFSDAGFAFGADAGTALGSDTITVDPAALVAEAAEREDASVKAKILFTPGTGEAQAKLPAAPAEVADADERDATPKNAASLAELVRLHGAPGELTAEERCLAGAVYFESKGESLPGQLAVARVVLARTKSGRFPTSICGVVYQKSQFSFVRGGRMPAINTGSVHWRNAVAISKIALDGSWKSPVEGALFFHARYVSPGWKLRRIGSIDNHVFYR
jgi:spore germination cell wall hydrolase CwlJ-like protein